ncbi:uncharacterized protein LOC144784508 [Lissotriton helveticus]
MPGSSSGCVEEAKTSNISLPRRLVSQSTIKGTGQSVNTGLHRLVRQTRIDSPRGKVKPPPSKSDHISGGNIGHGMQQGVPLRRKATEDCVPLPRLCKKKVSFSPQVQILAGHDVILYSPGALLQVKDAPTAGADRSPMASSGGILRQYNMGDTSDGTGGRVVDTKRKCVSRSDVSGKSGSSSGDDGGCVFRRMGSFPSGPSSQRSLEGARAAIAHKSAGAQSDPLGITSFSTKDKRFAGVGKNRHYGDALFEQARGNKISLPVSGSPGDMGMGSSARNIIGSRTPPRGSKRQGGYSQQTQIVLPRMGAGPGDPGQRLSKMGNTDSGPLRYKGKQEMPVLRKLASPEGILGECVFHGMVRRLCLHFSSNSSSSPRTGEDQERTVQADPGSPVVAQTTLVHGTTAAVGGPSNSVASNSIASDNVQGSGAPSGPEILAISSLSPEHCEFSHRNISHEFREILSKARAESTNKTYRMKWKRFCLWCKRHNVHPLTAAPHQIIPYILLLAKSGLAHASIKVHLAALSGYRRSSSGLSLWSSRIIKQFMKGIFRVFPPVKPPPPLWNLNIVLSQLMKPPFEPIHRADLKFLSWKAALLIALTSARREGELQALTIQGPFLQFQEDRMILRTNPKFIPKVPTDFHLNEPLVLKRFFPHPSTAAERVLHSLNVQR